MQEKLVFNDVKLNINYPNTKYLKVNKKIDFYLKKYIHDFYQGEFIQENFTYSLHIDYQEYAYKDYLSIVLFIDNYTGGAHPNYYLETIVFDTKTNRFLTIDDLILKNKVILDLLAKISLNHFLEIPAFKDKTIQEMLISGTSPSKDNFKKFVITDKGVKFYFERYQIAPYYFGSYDLTIPFSNLSINL